MAILVLFTLLFVHVLVSFTHGCVAPPRFCVVMCNVTWQYCYIVATQSDLVRIESTFERNSLDYELRIVDNKSGKERIARKFLINQFFTRAGTFRDDIFEDQFDDFCAVYLSKKGM